MGRGNMDVQITIIQYSKIKYGGVEAMAKQRFWDSPHSHKVTCHTLGKTAIILQVSCLVLGNGTCPCHYIN